MISVNDGLVLKRKYAQLWKGKIKGPTEMAVL